MSTHGGTPFLLLLPLFTVALLAQDLVPLKNWSAPLYWQPSLAGSDRAREKTSAVADVQSPQTQAAATSFLTFVAMTPCRVVDTRAAQSFPSPFGTPSLTPGPARSFPIQASTLCSIPNIAQAYSFNVTVVPPGPVGYLILYPHGQAQPNIVTLDDLQGQIVNNAAILPAGTVNGSIDAVVNGTTDLVIDLNGYYAPPTDLSLNTALGFQALMSNTSGADNTAFGTGSLLLNNTGSFNTASGYMSLSSNSSGNDNTATGYGALLLNTTGADNTADGYQALSVNTSGSDNTAIGSQALQHNTTGFQNTGCGFGTLFSNTTGHNNTAAGFDALFSNATGNGNTAVGYFALLGATGDGNTSVGNQALMSTSTGSANTATGSNALSANQTGSGNTAAGNNALSASLGDGNTALGNQALPNATGKFNLALGHNAGLAVTTGDGNILVANAGVDGESNTTRVGTDGNQARAFISGIKGVTVGAANGVAVLIDSNGQLGTTNSSRRFKEDIQDMGDASSNLLRLRPVTYRYKQPYADGSKPVDYGLIAEEVNDVYPDLVVKGADGLVETVQYQKLTPMLLNELQKEHERVRALQAQVSALQKGLETLMAGKASLVIAP